MARAGGIDSFRLGGCAGHQCEGGQDLHERRRSATAVPRAPKWRFGRERYTVCSRLPGRKGSPANPAGCVLSSAPSVLAVGALAALVALLRLDAERGDRPGLEALDADRLLRLLAIAVAAVLDPLRAASILLSSLRSRSRVRSSKLRWISAEAQSDWSGSRMSSSLSWRSVTSSRAGCRRASARACGENTRSGEHSCRVRPRTADSPPR